MQPPILEQHRQGDGFNRRQALFKCLVEHLDSCRQQQQTTTYLEVADAIGIQPPQRIHQLTELLEALMEHDQKQCQAQRAALVVSRSGAFLPANGFFLKAQTLGLITDASAEQFHQQCLKSLFDSSATLVD